MRNEWHDLILYSGSLTPPGPSATVEFPFPYKGWLDFSEAGKVRAFVFQSGGTVIMMR